MFRYISLFCPQNPNFLRTYIKGYDVLSSPSNISILYRAQDANNFFNPMTFFLGVFANEQARVINATNVVKHQQLTTLVGTTTKLSVAQEIAKIPQNAIILNIDPTGLRENLIDTGNTAKHKGTSFFTKHEECEQSLTVLPIVAIRKMEYVGKNGKVVANPFYIPLNPNDKASFEKFEKLYKNHVTLLETLYESASLMTASDRQALLNQLVALYNDFYQEHLGEGNPFNMTIAEFKQKYDAAFPDLFSGNGFDGNTKIIDVILNSGDELFNKHEPYKRLVSTGKRMHELLESEENPFLSYRGSHD